MCVSGYISKKIRVGRSLFKFLFYSKILFIFFPDFNKKHNRCIVCPKYIMKSMTTKVAKPITNGYK